MIILKFKSRPRYDRLLTYAMISRVMHWNTQRIDKEIQEYATREGISIVTAFEEFTDIAMDICAAQVIKEMQDDCIGF